MASWVIRIDPTLLPRLPSPNDRLHWAAKTKAVSAWRQAVYAETVRQEMPKLDRVRISVVFGRKSLGRTDQDNDVARCKPIIDGLVGCWEGKRGHRVFFSGPLCDDGRRYIPEPPVVSEKRSPEPYVEVTVMEVEE